MLLRYTDKLSRVVFFFIYITLGEPCNYSFNTLTHTLQKTPSRNRMSSSVSSFDSNPEPAAPDTLSFNHVVCANHDHYNSKIITLKFAGDENSAYVYAVSLWPLFMQHWPQVHGPQHVATRLNANKTCRHFRFTKE